MASRFTRSTILEESSGGGGEEDDKEISNRDPAAAAATTSVSLPHTTTSTSNNNNSSYQITLEFDDQSSLKRVRVKQDTDLAAVVQCSQQVVKNKGPVVNVRQLNSTTDHGQEAPILSNKKLKNATTNYKKRRSREDKMTSRRSSSTISSPNTSVRSSSSSSMDASVTSATTDRKLNRLRQRINKIKNMVGELKHQTTTTNSVSRPGEATTTTTSYSIKYYHKMYKLIENFLHIRQADVNVATRASSDGGEEKSTAATEDDALFEQFKVLCGPFMDWCQENKFDHRKEATTVITTAAGNDAVSSRVVQVNLSTTTCNTSRKSRDTTRGVHVSEIGEHNTQSSSAVTAVMNAALLNSTSTMRKSMSLGHLSRSEGDEEEEEEKESRAVRNHFVTLDVSDVSFTVNNSTPKDHNDFPIYSESKSNELSHLRKENKRLEEKLEAMNEEFRSLKKKIKTKNKVITRSDYENLIDQLNAFKEEAKTLRGRVQDLESENYQLKQMNVAGDDSGLDQYSAASSGGGNTLHLNDNYTSIMFSAERTLDGGGGGGIDRHDDDSRSTNLTLQNLF